MSSSLNIDVSISMTKIEMVNLFPCQYHGASQGGYHAPRPKLYPSGSPKTVKFPTPKGS